MRHSLILILGMMLVVLAGCVSQDSKPADGDRSALDAPVKRGERPTWVLSPPNERGQFYGVGVAELFGSEAEAIIKAKERARLDLLQSIQVEVSGEVSAITEVANNDVTRQMRTMVRNRVVTTQLDGLEISRVHIDEKNQSVYALAHLDARAAISRLRRDLAELDLQLAPYQQINEQQDVLEQIRQLSPALQVIEQALPIIARIKVLGGVVEGADDYQQISRRLDLLLGRLRVSVAAAGNAHNDAVRRVLIDHLTSQGLTVANGQGDIYIDYDVDMDDAIYVQRFYYVLTRGRVSVLDGRGNTLHSFQAETKGASGLSENTAQQQALTRLANRMGSGLAEALLTGL